MAVTDIENDDFSNSNIMQLVAQLWTHEDFCHSKDGPWPGLRMVLLTSRQCGQCNGPPL